MHLMKMIVGIISSVLIANVAMAMELTRFKNEDPKGNLTVASPNFVDALAKQKIERVLKFADRTIMINGDVGYTGPHIGELNEFLYQVDLFLKKYAEGIRFSPEEKIVVTDEDVTKIHNFSNYLMNGLFQINLRQFGEVNPSFKTFVEDKTTSGYDHYYFNGNSLFYGLMYFLYDYKDLQTEIYIPVNNVSAYNRYRFSFLPCPDDKKDSGEPLKLAFTTISNSLSYVLQADSDNVLKSWLYYRGNASSKIEASYTFSAFKVAQDTYRFRVNLSTTELYTSKKTSQKDVNFLVKIR